MKKLFEYKWQLVAIGLLAAGFVMSRAGVAAVMPLVRVLIPVLGVLLVAGLLKKRVSGAFGEMMRRQMEAAGLAPGAPGPTSASGGNKKNVIDLCPRCGSYMAPGHRCKKA